MDTELLEKEKCTICLNDLADNHSTLNCNHKYCTSCLEDLLNNNKYTCPLCRVQINEYNTNDNKVIIKYIKKTISIANRECDNIFIGVVILCIILFFLLTYTYNNLFILENYNRSIKICYLNCLYNNDECNLNITIPYNI